jgi:hypothetical protein
MALFVFFCVFEITSTIKTTAVLQKFLQCFQSRADALQSADVPLWMLLVKVYKIQNQCIGSKIRI